MSHRGALRSENVGISSKKTGENPVHRKPKVSRATKIAPGLAGPKTRPKGVVDGQQVNIPALPQFFDGETHSCIFRESRNDSLGAKGCSVGKSAEHKPRREREPDASRASEENGVPRKSSRAKAVVTVP